MKLCLKLFMTLIAFLAFRAWASSCDERTTLQEWQNKKDEAQRQVTERENSYNTALNVPISVTISCPRIASYGEKYRQNLVAAARGKVVDDAKATLSARRFELVQILEVKPGPLTEKESQTHDWYKALLRGDLQGQ